MNVCVINQLNQHLTTRFHKQQQDICLKKNTNTIKEDKVIEEKTNVYDEPENIETSKTTSTHSTDLPTTSPVPPPPPPYV
jgi:hypothetical protein